MYKINNKVYEIVEKGLNRIPLEMEEIRTIFHLDPLSREAYYVRWAGMKKSMEMADGFAEIHGQIGLDTGPCPQKCHCCSFAGENAHNRPLAKTAVQDVLDYARIFQDDGANLLLLMTTVLYPFNELFDVCAKVREAVGPDMPILINTRDMSYEEALAFKQIGINGAYHAIRLSEGVLTDIPVEKRIETMKALTKAKLPLSVCIEPIGPEHTVEEFVEKINLHLEENPVTSGVGRRVSVCGTTMECSDMLTQHQHALYTALYRLMDNKTRLTASAHSVLLANSGANLCWAEAGCNPRDMSAKTEKGGIGKSVAEVAKVFTESGWQVKKGYSEGWNMTKE